MPELPEVETLRRDVEETFGGRRVLAASATGARTLRRYGSAADFSGRVRGGALAAVGRRGKYLLLHLHGRTPEDAEPEHGAPGEGVVVVVHMGMSGQLRAASVESPPWRHTHVVVTFEGGGELRFVDPRTFGEVFLTTVGPGGADPPELAHLGPEPLGASMTPGRLGDMLRARRSRLKPLLMDQRWMAGIGNMYADEILWSARLRHDRRGADLSRAQVRRLHVATQTVLADAIAHRGSSLRDEQYRDVNGRLGGYQVHHRVYDREGLACPRCATPVTRVKAYGRSTWYCPRCQR